MTISKRTRFEVLRRDSHKCHYCGAGAPEATLQIDHVIPVSLGGSDKPSNLVAACHECNSGKSSIRPDAELVDEVDVKAEQWAAAREVAARRIQARREEMEAAQERFLTVWRRWDPEGDQLPSDWRESIERWLRRGLTEQQLADALSVALGARFISDVRVFRYMAGVIKRTLEELDEETERVLRGE